MLSRKLHFVRRRSAAFPLEFFNKEKLSTLSLLCETHWSVAGASLASPLTSETEKGHLSSQSHFENQVYQKKGRDLRGLAPAFSSSLENGLKLSLPSAFLRAGAAAACESVAWLA